MDSSTSLSRDDFPEATKRLLATRVNHRCSNPDCGAPTSGPQSDPNKSLNVGVAAHITAAAPGGPRYEPTITSQKRSDISNGIWLCQTCAKLVDNDATRFTATVLRSWKSQAEEDAFHQIGKSARTPTTSQVTDKWVNNVISAKEWSA